MADLNKSAKQCRMVWAVVSWATVFYFDAKRCLSKIFRKRLWQDISRDFLTQIWSPFFRCFGVSQITISHSLMVICETTKPNWSLEKVSQVLRTLSGTKLLLFRVWGDYRCKMATKSPRDRLLNRSPNRRKIAGVNGPLLYSSSTLSHTQMHCANASRSVDGHTRCLGGRLFISHELVIDSLTEIYFKSPIWADGVHRALHGRSKIFLPLRSLLAVQ